MNHDIKRKESVVINFLIIIQEIYYKTELGMYMFYEMKLYLQRHQLIYNLGRVHTKLKEVKKEIDRREHVHKTAEDLIELYKELCVIFYEYYDAFSEDVE